MEMKLLTAMFLLGYEYELVDGAGNLLERLPLQDRNDIQQVRMAAYPCSYAPHMSYRRGRSVPVT